jgi:uncharacterized SAM-binding protein YcdF (DUF218 family)
VNRTTKRARRGQPLFAIACLALVLYAFGFGVFAGRLPVPATDTPMADGIVALTGESDRLAPAVMLLEQGSGRRLLITGVNRQITKPQLKALLHAGPAFDCCADLGFAAEDTRGNALEAANWVHERGYGSLIVVTADYHMPRSLLEFAAEMPDVKLVPYPIAETAAPPWQTFRRLNGEYAKYLASMVRISFLHFARDA